MTISHKSFSTPKKNPFIASDFVLIYKKFQLFLASKGSVSDPETHCVTVR
jgi:hypothetical protein